MAIYSEDEDPNVEQWAKNALMIMGISFVLSGMILITTTVLGGIPCLVGGLMFGYGVGIK